MGGKEEQRTLGFNGIYTKYVLRTEAGAYIGKLEDMNKFFATQGPDPNLIQFELKNYPLVTEPVFRT